VSSARVQVASRTDRGVSAVGNAFAFTSAWTPSALLRALNGAEADIAVTALSAVPDSFRVRSATRRVYRYFQPGESHDFELWQTIARRFSGDVDVRSFGRGLPANVPVRRTIESVTVTPIPGGAVVEIRAPSFVWGMVRKIVATLREVEAGRISTERLDSALRGGARLTVPMAEPEPLVLWDVEYHDLRWEHHWAGPNRRQLTWITGARERLWTRRAFLDAFAGTRSVSKS
jgi:tRNA pseudouridine38-40 synthase